jgi:hypothetical protein
MAGVPGPNGPTGNTGAYTVEAVLDYTSSDCSHTVSGIGSLFYIDSAKLCSYQYDGTTYGNTGNLMRVFKLGSPKLGSNTDSTIVVYDDTLSKFIVPHAGIFSLSYTLRLGLQIYWYNSGTGATAGKHGFAYLYIVIDDQKQLIARLDSTLFSGGPNYGVHMIPCIACDTAEGQKVFSNIYSGIWMGHMNAGQKAHIEIAFGGGVVLSTSTGTSFLQEYSTIRFTCLSAF